MITCAWCRSRSTVAVAIVLGVQLVEAGAVDVGAHRDRPFLVGGVDDSEQSVGGVRGDWDQADVIDQDQL